MTYDNTMPEFSPATLKKAEALLAKDGAVKPHEIYPNVWEVQGTATAYRVQLDLATPPRWATCTCPHGLNSSGTPRCYHVSAVLMTLEDSEESDQ